MGLGLGNHFAALANHQQMVPDELAQAPVSICGYWAGDIWKAGTISFPAGNGAERLGQRERETGVQRVQPFGGSRAEPRLKRGDARSARNFWGQRRTDRTSRTNWTDARATSPNSLPLRRGKGGARAASARGAVTGRQIDLPRNPETFRGVTVPRRKCEIIRGSDRVRGGVTGEGGENKTGAATNRFLTH